MSLELASLLHWRAKKLQNKGEKQESKMQNTSKYYTVCSLAVLQNSSLLPFLRKLQAQPKITKLWPSFPIQPKLFGPNAQESQTLDHDRRGRCHCLQGSHSDLSHLGLAGLKLSEGHVRQPFIINLRGARVSRTTCKMTTGELRC